MELKIKWTDFAKNELKNIYNYYYENVSVNTANKIVNGITNDVTVLENHPEIGQVEELLIGSEEKFRYLLSKRNYKLIYWINIKKRTIEIVDVFDVRQNPIKMNKER